MAEAILNIKRWGKGLGVRFTAAFAREANLQVDQRVRVSVDGDQLIVTPVHVTRPTLEQRLDALDIKRHGGERMPTTVLGTERW